MPFTNHTLRPWAPLFVVAAAACWVPTRVPPAWAEPQAAAHDTKPDTADEDDRAAAGGCLSCTGSPRMVPICRKVPVKKKKPHVEYEMKCELICVPGCGCVTHGHHTPVGCTDCDEGHCDDVRVRQKKLLVKKVTEKETESYEYKVDWVCVDCAAGRGCYAGPTSGLIRFFPNWFW